MVTSFKSIISNNIDRYYKELSTDINNFVLYSLYKLGCKPNYKKYLYQNLLNKANIESYCVDFNKKEECDTSIVNRSREYLRYKKCVINKYKLKSKVCVRE